MSGAFPSVARTPLPLDLCVVRGKEPLAALQKVVTADLRGLREGEIRRSVLLHAKGQFRALFAVASLAQEVFLLAPPGRGPLLAELLNAYLRFSRCAVEVLVPPRLLVLGEPLAVRQALGLAWLPETGGCAGSGELLAFGESLLGLPGTMVAGKLDRHLQAVEATELELARIRSGFPAWGQELTEDVLPPEVGLGEAWVSLRKGCYVGQETMARLATYGHVNRQLVRVQSPNPQPLPGPLPLPLSLPGEPKPAGRLTSWAYTATHSWGLALVHRRAAVSGGELSGGGRLWKVEAILA